MVHIAGRRLGIKDNSVALKCVGASSHRGAAVDADGAAARTSDGLIAQGAAQCSHRKGTGIGGNHTGLKFTADPPVCIAFQPYRRLRGCANQCHGVAIQIGRGLVIGVAGDRATGVAHRCCQLKHVPRSFDRDAAIEFGGTGISGSLDLVNVHIAADTQVNVFARQVRIVAYFSYIGVPAGANVDGAAARNNRINEQPVRLVDGDVA